MVFGALSFGLNRPPSGPIGGANTDYRTIEVTGEQLSRMESGGEVVRLTRVGEGEDMTMQVLAEFGALSDDTLRGPHFKIDADLEANFAGHTIEITITARPTQERGAEAMLVNYSTGKDADSGWLRFDLETDYSEYRFTYDVPDTVTERGLDYLGIKPEVPSKTRGIEIKNVTFNLLGRWTR